MVIDVIISESLIFGSFDAKLVDKCIKYVADLAKR